MSLFTTLDQVLASTLEQPSLPNLADLCRTAERAEEAVDAMVTKLREEGTTWRVLAEATGMTQQGLMARQARLQLDRSEVTA